MYETILLSNLICRKEFRTEALSYLRKEYFQDPVHRWTFIMIADYVKKYGEAPTKENLLVDLARCSDIGEQQYRDTAKYIDEQLKFDDNNNLDWLLATTQEFCGSRAVEHEMYDCIAIIGDKDRKQERPLIPSKLQAALTLSFKQPDDDIVNHFKNYKPPKYLVEDLFEVGKVYSLTGLWGAGKTAVATSVAWHVATGSNFGYRTVRGGKVVYFSGEDDVIRRLLGMTNGIMEPGILDVKEGTGRQVVEEKIARLIAKGEEIALVILDTSTSFFEGERGENDNTDAYEHAISAMPSIIARIASDEEAAEHEVQDKQEHMQVLELLTKDAKMSQRDMANRLLWFLRKGDPDHKKVGRVLKHLKDTNLINGGNGAAHGMFGV